MIIPFDVWLQVRQGQDLEVALGLFRPSTTTSAMFVEI